ncbi:phage tail protein I [Neorhizobium sp. T786]|uniref:phage tail protein I n=1 Tax=Pseudorhizobium xiangyangii TaxID=2883104 RepID=UPI001CFF9E11|nr:phage tail protein I [Neorhizobium xiangyangii]MCB5201721.1 phage tail protein I [Neorhizobium xiangyangii]
MFESIIPHTTKIERDAERATAFPDLPIDGLASFVDPMKIDARFLPWLAYRFAVDIWNDEWTEEKKRDVVAQQFELHRLKGTEEGIRRTLSLVDATLLETVRFPQRAFAMRPVTKEQRDAWLARMPEIRVYLHTERGMAGADAFGRPDGIAPPSSFAGHAFARLDRAEAIYGRRAVIRYPDGREVSVRRSTVETVTETKTAAVYDRIHIPGEIGPALFVGGFARGRFVTRRNTAAQIVTFSLDRTYDAKKSELHLSTAAPSLQPIDVKYERISDTAPAGPSLFVGQFLKRKFVTDDRAEWHLFDRVRLQDPDVDAPWARAHSFANRVRIGMKPFHAELLVESKSRKIRRAAYANRSYFGGVFSTKENLTKLKWVYAAIRRSKAVRDRILVDTQTLRRRTFGGGIPFDGSFKFGDRVRNTLK